MNKKEIAHSGLDEVQEARVCLLGDYETSALKNDSCFSWSQDVVPTAWQNMETDSSGDTASSVTDWASGLKTCNPVAWSCDVPLRKENAVDYTPS